MAMKTRPLAGGLLAGFLMTLALGPAESASDSVTIGVGGPITGPNAAFGQQLVMGATQAVEDQNARGGLLGHPMTILQGDDASDPKQGVSVANKFVGDSVKFIVGHFNSGVSIPASDVYGENGILMITPASTNPALTERGKPLLFRTVGRDDQQSDVAAQYIQQHFAGKKIAIFHDKTTYGKGLADDVKGRLAKMGIDPVVYEAVNPGEKDYSAVVTKIKSGGVDLVYWGGYHTEAGLIRRQMTDQGVKAVMMSDDGITDNEFAAIAGPGAEGTLMTFGPDPRKKPTAAQVVKEFAAKNFDPQAYTLYSYAAVEVLVQAAEAAKSIDPAMMARTMHSGMTFHTVLGDIAYDRKGDVTKADYVIYTWKKQADGTITYVENE